MAKSSAKGMKGGRATEKDVLMGRGKRVSEWPGNIYFRQVVNKNREPYHDAERSKKVYVAQAVIAAIHDIGGRFLKEESDGSWTEIEHPRSIEKTCQALREKEKPNPPMMNPFDGADFPNGPPPQKKQKMDSSSSKKKTTADGVSVTGSTTESEDEDGEGKSDDDDSSLETDTDGSDDDDDTDDDGSDDDDDDDDDDSQIAAPRLDNGNDEDDDDDNDNAPATKIPVWQHEDMMRLLENFKRSYGDCAVPSAWTKDEDLADWSTVQRQHYREVKSGYREASPQEKKRFKDLDDMGFCWDYDKWHWELKYRALADWYKDLVTKQKTAGKVVAKGQPTVAPARDLVEWLQDQRRQYREGQWLIPVERVEKLRQIGVSF
jgi:hypothetical protein